MSCRGRGKAIRDLQVFWGFSSWIQRSTHEVAIAGSREYQVETKYTPCTHLYDTATHTNHDTENVSHTCGLLHSSLLCTCNNLLVRYLQLLQLFLGYFLLFLCTSLHRCMQPLRNWFQAMRDTSILGTLNHRDILSRSLASHHRS